MTLTRTPNGWSVERLDMLNEAMAAADYAVQIRTIINTLGLQNDPPSIQVRTDLENLAKALLTQVRNMS